MRESALRTRAAGPTNERRALRQLYILFSVCWVAFVLFGVHIHWGHQMRLTAQLIGTLVIALVPPAFVHLLFYVIHSAFSRLMKGPKHNWPQIKTD
jgi:hypothetical protein